MSFRHVDCNEEEFRTAPSTALETKVSPEVSFKRDRTYQLYRLLNSVKKVADELCPRSLHNKRERLESEMDEKSQQAREDYVIETLTRFYGYAKDELIY